MVGMSAITELKGAEAGTSGAAAASGQAVSPADLAELISAFNDVTADLSKTHGSLRSEVERLESELREARTQLARAQQLAGLGEMAAGIAHEVRNPLGSIRLFASVLSEDLTDRPEQQEIAKKIAGAVSGLDAVVNDVLVFSKQLTPRISRTPAEILIDHAIAACADVIGRGNVQVCRRIPSEMAVDCDPHLLHQALVNIIRNACDAMSDDESPCESPVLAIEVSRKRSLDADGNRCDMASITVTDCGPGASPDVLARAFNPFFTTRHTGTGLGLAIVHRIIDAHMGRVMMRNNAPEGTGLTVEFLIPHTAEHNALKEYTR